jgi:TerB N-terminal domain
MTLGHSTGIGHHNSGNASTPGLKWCGTGVNVSLTGGINLRLLSPMIYVFQGSGNARNDEPASIDVRLPVSEHEHVSTVRELGYWPRYDGLTPGQRRSYLQWIAQGRASIPPELGYTFLFLYGLERRALVEQADQQEIFQEVIRLRKLYAATGVPRNHSFDSYTGSFLWFLVVRHPQLCSLADLTHLVQSPGIWSDQTLSSAIYWFAATHRTLSDWAAMRISQSLPGSRTSVASRRVSQQFQALFIARYLRKFPGGLPPAPASSHRTYVYRPSSAALRQIEFVAPDYASSIGYYGPLSELWNECSDELYRLGVMARTSSARGRTGPSSSWPKRPAAMEAGRGRGTGSRATTRRVFP